MTAPPDPPMADPDLVLVERARAGSAEAVAELWSRHHPTALRVAHHLVGNPHDAEDVAADAFSRMLSAILDGAGPTGSVSAYLKRAVRNLVINRAERRESHNVVTDDPELYVWHDASADPVAHSAELGLVREAFDSLPMRWRTVLWRTAVDRDPNTVVARHMGISANAVAALAGRARAGFRTAYVQAHLSRGAVDRACQPYVVLLPSMVTTRVRTPKLTAHLETCGRCRDRAAELAAVERKLGSFVLPAFLTAPIARLREGGVVVRLRVARHARPRPALVAVLGIPAVLAAVVASGGPAPEDPPAPATAVAPAPSVAARPRDLPHPPVLESEPLHSPPAGPGHGSGPAVALAPRGADAPHPSVPGPRVRSGSPPRPVVLTRRVRARPAPDCHVNHGVDPDGCDVGPPTPAPTRRSVEVLARHTLRTDASSPAAGPGDEPRRVRPAGGGKGDD